MKAQAIKITSVVFAVVIALFAVPPMVSAANIKGIIMTANFTKHAKKVTFSVAKVGDRVWSLTEGWGTILERFRSRAEYPLVVEFDNRSQKTYTLWGLLHYKDLNPTLFWDEVKIETPEKPLPALEVDTKVLVWVDPEQKYKRHFSNF